MDSFAGLRVRKPPPRQRRKPTARDREAAWEVVERRLRRKQGAFEEVLPLLRALKATPALNPRAYRLLCAYGRQELGFDVVIIARELGLSIRHTRRLIRKYLAEPLAKAAHRWTRVEARRLVAELRAGLQAEGFRFHRWVMRGKRRVGPPTHPEVRTL